MTTVSGRTTLRAARQIIAQRGGRPGTGEIAYLTYAGCLVSAIAVFPVLRLIVLGLATPTVQALTRLPTAVGVITLAGSILVSGALLLGPVRGPAVPRPFLIQYLLGSPIPRRLGLRRPFLSSSAVLAVVFVVAADMIVIAHSVSAAPTGGTGEPLAAAELIIAALAFSILLSVTWLLGQAAPRRVTSITAVIILATGVLAAWGPIATASGVATIAINMTPWGWLALSWHGLSTATPLVWPAAALVLSLVCLAAIPALLDSVSTPALLAQSRRWQTTGVLLTTGDAAAAVGGFRPPPSRAAVYTSHSADQ